MNLHQSGGTLAGTLHGDLSVPDWVPWIGGKSCGSVDATLDGSTFRGTATVTLTPGIPEICIPQGDVNIPQCFQAWWCNSCRHCVDIGITEVCASVPCDCGWHDVCGPRVHVPAICTPAIPGTHASFDFSFDPATGQISFGAPSIGSGGVSAKSSPTRGSVFSNWSVLAPAEAGPHRGPTREGPNPVVRKTFSLSAPAPGIIFRTVYATNASVSQVNMIVRTPAGVVLDSAQGTLPLGYGSVLGYSRFHPGAHEQIILLANPVAGDYEVTVEEAPELGAFTIEAWVQNAAPTGRITSILPGPGAGQYVVAWEDHDLESTNAVRIYLDPDRGGHDGFQVGWLAATNNVGHFTIETAGLNVAPGQYFVYLVIDDGQNAPVSCISDKMINVCPAGVPQPVSGVQYLPENGAFKIGWNSSPTLGVVGYRVEWTTSHEDPTRMHNSVWVPATGRTNLITEVKGLANGSPVLVRVVAVDEQLRRSMPSDLIRITPRAAGKIHAPIFASTPDADATAGYAYAYLPLLDDRDGAEAYVWSLVQGPTNLTVDAACGLVRWTPTAAQVGKHHVVLQVEERFLGQSAGVYASQSYTLRVYPPDDLSGLEAHNYFFLSVPQSDTGEGLLYHYQPIVLGPDQNLRYELLAGPEGMTVDAASGLVTWAVPPGTRGAWVRLQAVAGGKHTIEQDYYLYVFSEDQLLPSLQLVAALSPAGQIMLGLFGTGSPSQSWTIQTSTNLAQWSDLTEVILTNGIPSILTPASSVAPVRYFRGRR